MPYLNNIGTLARIGLKPGATLGDRLTIARHVLRALCAEHHTLRRKANQMRYHLPFPPTGCQKIRAVGTRQPRH